MTESKATLGFWFGIAIASTLAAPFLYLLLLGPLQFLTLKEVIPYDVSRTAGYPLMLWGYYVGYCPEWFMDLYGGYISWWATLAGLPT